MQHLPTWTNVVLWTLAGIGYLTICFVGWYLLAAFNYGMNGGQLGRHPLLFPFQCFAEELPCYLPGGKEHRIHFIKDRVRDWDGVMLGSRKSWTYQEIREKGLYEEVFYGMVGGHLSFWGGNFFNFFGSPFIVGLYILFFSGIGIIGSLSWVGCLIIKPFSKESPTQT